MGYVIYSAKCLVVALHGNSAVDPVFTSFFGVCSVLLSESSDMDGRFGIDGDTKLAVRLLLPQKVR